MVAVILACCSAALFGWMTVTTRSALRGSPDPYLGAFATTSIGLVVLLALAAGDAVAHGFGRPSDLWPFFAAGLLGPGASQLCFTRAVKEAGPSRTSVVVGAAPLVSAAIALGVLGEPFRIELVVGAVLIVGGGFALVSERARPEHVAVAGLVLAFGAATFFSIRDNLVRWLSGDTTVAPLVAAATALLAATLFLGASAAAASGRRALVARARASLRDFVPTGLLFGLSYALVFEAYFHGRVTVVSPLVATESLWGVLLSALLVGRSELIGRRLVAGAVLIVAGGALIGATR